MIYDAFHNTDNEFQTFRDGRQSWLTKQCLNFMNT